MGLVVYIKISNEKITRKLKLNRKMGRKKEAL